MSITRLLGTMWRVGREERLSRCRMLEVQKLRLRRLLEHVLSHSTFYRTYYRTYGITADKLDGLELRHLPPIDKQIVMEHFDALVCDPAITRAGIERFLHDCDDPGVRYKGVYHVMHTSGSTGQPALFVYGAGDWRIAQALVGTRVLRYRPTLGRIRYAFLVKSCGHYAGIQLAQSASRLGFKRLVLSIDDPIDRTLERLQRFQPHLLGGYPSGLAMLAEQQLQGNLRILPRKIIASGEHLDRGARALIESAFATRPVNLYAASESLAFGASCPHHKGIHLFDDWHCFEIDGAPGGARGRLTLTNLYNYTQPLIRYEMTDEIELADTPCPCGWPFLLAKDVTGRTEERLWFEKADGTRDCIHPAVIATLYTPGLAKLQAVQTGPRELLLRLKTTGRSEEIILQVKREVAKALRQKHLDRDISIRTEIVDEIPNDPGTGKYKLVVPYPPAKLPAGNTP
ncbi:MAG: phenylacetate--CoA ligase family protein [Phycisphaerae bacterium]|nr:phenylacetate--CoA ligase family protein [Phycisphaerae bacterium]